MSKQKESLVIYEDVVVVMGIIDELIDYEKTEWCKTFFMEIKRGKKDISIITNSPMERTKYYTIKNAFIDKIYQCCIFKGLVEYEDILNTKIGQKKMRNRNPEEVLEILINLLIMYIEELYEYKNIEGEQFEYGE